MHDLEYKILQFSVKELAKVVLGCNPFEGIPYSLKFSRTKIFVDFVVFEAPTKILSLKISYKLANPTCN